jgi:hypothetical protein
MKKTIYLVIAVAVLLSALAWSGYGQRKGARKPSWEYLIVSTGQAEFRDAAGLNKLGAEGWELVSVGTTDNAGNSLLYLKRAR